MIDDVISTEAIFFLSLTCNTEQASDTDTFSLESLNGEKGGAHNLVHLRHYGYSSGSKLHWEAKNHQTLALKLTFA